MSHVFGSSSTLNKQPQLLKQPLLIFNFFFLTKWTRFEEILLRLASDSGFSSAVHREVLDIVSGQGPPVNSPQASCYLREASLKGIRQEYHFEFLSIRGWLLNLRSTVVQQSQARIRNHPEFSHTFHLNKHRSKIIHFR